MLLCIDMLGAQRTDATENYDIIVSFVNLSNVGIFTSKYFMSK